MHVGIADQPSKSLALADLRQRIGAQPAALLHAPGGAGQAPTLLSRTPS